jgi:hypothetical protein
MIGRVGQGTAAAALASVVLGLPACGGGSSTPPAPRVPPQIASVDRTPLAPAASSCTTMVCIYVTNVTANSVTVYAKGANGDVPPIQAIAGSHTALHVPQGIALDAARNIYVVNHTGLGSVTVYPAGANGDVAPTQTISGSKTGMNGPEGIALDSSLNIYVANSFGGASGLGSVTVYPAGANGNVAPIRTISGSNTGLNFPEGITLDASLNVYVTTFVGGPSGLGNVSVYAAGANGNVAPVRTITGSNTRLHGPVGIALGRQGGIYVVNYDSPNRPAPGSVTVYPAGTNGNVAPLRTISGSNTGLFGSLGIARDGSGIHVVNQQGGIGRLGSVTAYATGANGNVAPIQTISGPNTQLKHPAGVAVR